MKKLVVAQGKSLLHKMPNGIMKRFRAGEALPTDLDKGWIEKNPSYVEEIEVKEDASKAAPKAPAKPAPKGLPKKPLLDKKPAATKPKSEEKFAFDPALLAKKSLDQLNVMIVEQDPKAQTFETVEEATAFLTQNFKP